MSFQVCPLCFTKSRLRVPSTTGESRTISRGTVFTAVSFSSSVFLVTVHDPICTESGDLSAALYGSFLPVPVDDAFPVLEPSEYSREKALGAVVVKKERIIINHGRKRIKLHVTNSGDRPIQVRRCFNEHVSDS